MFGFLRTMRPSALFHIKLGAACVATFTVFVLKVLGGTPVSSLAWQVPVILLALAALFQPWRYVRRLKVSPNAPGMLELSSILAAVGCLVPGQTWLLVPAALFVFIGARSERLVTLAASAPVLISSFAVFRMVNLQEGATDSRPLLWLALCIVLGVIGALVIEGGCMASKKRSVPTHTRHPA